MSGLNGLQPFNLVLGPARIYSGVFGATEPTLGDWNSTPAASAWYDAGLTNGDTTTSIDPKYTILTADQIVDKVGARLTDRDILVSVVMAEMTLQNIANAWNTTLGASGANYQVLDPNFGASAVKPSYQALLIDGIAPTGNVDANWKRRTLLRKILPTGKQDYVNSKDKQQGIAVQYQAFYVSETVPPFRFIDQTA
jgi:hypothetical protein